MLEESFERLYLQFRANYYRRMVEKIGARDGSLSATECFSVEIIYLMGQPTIGEFAHFLNISLPNANYKINNLVEKDYVKKHVSESDKREVRLKVTDKFLAYYALNRADQARVMEKIQADFSAAEIRLLEDMVERISVFMERPTERGEKEFD